MYHIIGKNRHGLVSVLPQQYDSYGQVNKSVQKYANEQLENGAQFVEHLSGISTAYFPDGSQVEYWRTSEELLQKGHPIF